MGGDEPKDALQAEFRRRRKAWRGFWNLPLTLALVLVWAPVALYLVRELSVSLVNGTQEFVRLPSALFPVPVEKLARPFVGLGYDLEYFARLLRWVLGAGAALGLASCYTLDSRTPHAERDARWSELRAAVRAAVYRWTTLLLLAPSVMGLLARNVGTRPAFADVLGVLFPLILLAADWLSLSELLCWLVLRFRQRSPAWCFGWAMLLVLVYFLANFYLPKFAHWGSTHLVTFWPLLTDGLLVGFSLATALVWYRWTLSPAPGFTGNEEDRAPRRFENGTRLGRMIRDALARYGGSVIERWPRVLLRIGAAALILGWGWVSLVKSGALVDTDVYADPDLTIPVLSTRGHCHFGKLVKGKDPYSYDVEGTISEGADDLIVVIHGFNNDAEKARYKFDLAKSSLRAAGFDGEVVGWSWDADTQHDPMSSTGYHTGDRHAALNGRKLAAFVRDFKQENPGAYVHVIGYSMGARVALEALYALEHDPEFMGGATKIDTVHLCGASVDNETVEIGERYGWAIKQSAGTLFNYHSADDVALGAFYWLKEADRSLGENGAEDPSRLPSNYVEIDASRELKLYDVDWNVIEAKTGSNHKGYLGIKNPDGKLMDDGAMDLVTGNLPAHVMYSDGPVLGLLERERRAC